MILHYKKYDSAENAEALLILHGLYGQQGNWAAHARYFAGYFSVYALDARNHGQSPHADSMRLKEMVQDVVETLDALELEHVHVLGHSMGGKIAMLLALLHPERVLDLIVVDIAPVAYPTGDIHVLKGLQALDLATIESRAQADEALAACVHTKAVRDFLLANLQRAADGTFNWRFNLPVLGRYFGDIIGWEETDKHYKGPVLFIRGANSDYILPAFEAATVSLFPKAALKTVTGAGHWVHSEKPETFQKLVLNFLQSLHH